MVLLHVKSQKAHLKSTLKNSLAKITEQQQNFEA